MKKIIPLSFFAVMSIAAAEVQLKSIGVASTMLTEVAQDARESTDLAEALSAKVPSIDMVRRSAIANDVLIRGQKRDNISIEVDGTKVCGACPNRMDPPTSHILTNQIETIEVTEGPFDVTTFGVMSGGVKITTKAPTKEFHGEITGGLGSWGYKKAGFTASGGNDTVRMLISGSTESSEQYEDGNGDDFAQQIAKNPAAPLGTQYQDKYKNMDAYEKKSIMAKAFISVADNQELRLSVTANRSDNILYPNSKMDAIYDDSNIYSIEYDVKNLGKAYKNLNVQYYASDVDHPMGTDYRKSSTGTNMMTGKPNPTMTNSLTTDMQGLKIKNTFDVADAKLLIGVDGSQRDWDGHYEVNHVVKPWKSINNAQTENLAVFAKLDKSYGALDVSFGARYDATDITNDGGLQNNSYDGFNANIMTTYNLDKNSKVFLGIGQANRVPDARELYFTSAMSYSMNTGAVIGTDNLDQTTNREIDLGYETTQDSFSAKVKAFYSDLSDYIYIKKGTANNAFENIDAKVYGAELSGEYFASDDITIDASISYKRGKKEEALAGQTDTDLADMAPLRGSIAATYEYANNSSITAEVQASDTWDKIDSDNGEQVLDSWTILNLKAKHSFNKNFELLVGVNNVFDQTYATSNTYADLILISAGVNANDVMLMNDPGRYLYTNLTYRF